MAREIWATRLGFILTAAGSTVGLGNIWRFPWQTAEDGGSVFFAVYLGIVLLVSVPELLGEFAIGRRVKRSPINALHDLSEPRKWGIVGALSVVTGISLSSSYSVVGGWATCYFLESVATPAGDNPAYFTNPGQYPGGVSADVDATLYHFLFLGLTALVVFASVRKGIEPGTKVITPAVFVFLVGLAGQATTQPNAAAGYAFFLRSNPSVIAKSLFAILSPAVGQALLTPSLGVGMVITYSSYLRENHSLPFDGSVIVVLNTNVGVVTGLVVFPLLFSQNINPTKTDTGPDALFVDLTGTFSQLPAGTLIVTAFFGVMIFAALLSSTSMLEIPVAFLVDGYGVSHRHAASGTAAFVAVTRGACTFNPGIFGPVTGPLVSVLLTAGSTTFLLLVGWVMGHEALEELTAGMSEFSKLLDMPWLFAIGVVLPLFLVFTLLARFGVGTVIDFWPTVSVAAVASAATFLGLRQPDSVA